MDPRFRGDDESGSDTTWPDCILNSSHPQSSCSREMWIALCCRRPRNLHNKRRRPSGAIAFGRIAPRHTLQLLSDMPNYRRVFVPGGCYFFTVNLLDRNSRLLVEHIDSLRTAMRDTRRAFLFEIDAMGDPAGSHPRDLDIAGGRFRFLRPLALDQNPLLKIDPKERAVGCRPKSAR